eukprot:302908_1
MTSVILCSLLILQNINIIFGNCKFNIPDYGLIDLNGLSHTSITAEMRDSPRWSLTFTPCRNGCECIDGETDIKVMVIQNDNDNPDICMRPIVSWDNGHVQPILIEDKTDKQIIFEYPIEPNEFTGGCMNGRQGHITFICDENSDPYNKDMYEVWQGDTMDGVCQYYIVMETKYACPVTDTSDSISSMSGGTVFIIIVIVLFSSYCLIGYIFNGYKRNEWKDIKQNTPHLHTFWVYLPSLVVTGCRVSYEYLYSVIGKESPHQDTLIDDGDE